MNSISWVRSMIATSFETAGKMVQEFAVPHAETESVPICVDSQCENIIYVPCGDIVEAFVKGDNAEMEEAAKLLEEQKALRTNEQAYTMIVLRNERSEVGKSIQEMELREILEELIQYAEKGCIKSCERDAASDFDNSATCEEDRLDRQGMNECMDTETSEEGNEMVADLDSTCVAEQDSVNDTEIAIGNDDKVEEEANLSHAIHTIPCLKIAEPMMQNEELTCIASVKGINSATQSMAGESDEKEYEMIEDPAANELSRPSAARKRYPKTLCTTNSARENQIQSADNSETDEDSSQNGFSITSSANDTLSPRRSITDDIFFRESDLQTPNEYPRRALSFIEHLEHVWLQIEESIDYCADGIESLLFDSNSAPISETVEQNCVTGEEYDNAFPRMVTPTSAILFNLTPGTPHPV